MFMNLIPEIAKVMSNVKDSGFWIEVWVHRKEKEERESTNY